MEAAFNEAECWSYYLAKATRTKEKISAFLLIQSYIACKQLKCHTSSNLIIRGNTLINKYKIIF